MSMNSLNIITANDMYIECRSMSSVYSVSPPWACMSYASVLTTRNQINRLSSTSQVMAWNVWPGFPCAVNEELQILRTQNDMHFVSKRRFPSCPVMRRLGGAAWWCNLRSLGSFPPHSLELVPVTQRPGLWRHGATLLFNRVKEYSSNVFQSKLYTCN